MHLNKVHITIETLVKVTEYNRLIIELTAKVPEVTQHIKLADFFLYI